MFAETKEAVRRTIQVCQVLFSMDPDDYGRLLEVTNSITFPDRNEVAKVLRGKFKDEVISEEEFVGLIDAALVEELQTKYSDAAVEAGFDAEQGLAMLEYAAIIKDLEEDGYA